MAKVSFFTAVSFADRPKSCTQSLLETADSYFYLGGKKAYVIPGHTQSDAEGAVLSKDSPAFLITALKVVSYLTVALPIATLIVKAVLRSIHTFHTVDVKQKVEEGIDIPEETIEKIQALLPKIQRGQDDPEIVQYTSKNLIFSLRSVPNLIFKDVNDADGRFENMVKAQEVCLIHQLGLLIIPHAKKFQVDGRTFIAEQRFDIQQHESSQERLYTELPGLNETARQLATFIAKTGFSDVEWRNMPIVDDEPEFHGSRHVALVDLEEMGDPETGIFGRGGFARRGLIRCLSSEQQIDIALAEARRCGIVSRWVTPEEVKARRIDEVQKYEQLQQFYTRNGILENARKPIQIDDLNTLGLNLDEQEHLLQKVLRNDSNGEARIEYSPQPIALRDAVVDVIAQINTLINEAPAATAKGMRYILLNTNHGTLRDYFLIGNRQESQTWMDRIISTLVAKGHLFKLDEVNGHGYFIQA